MAIARGRFDAGCDLSISKIGLGQLLPLAAASPPPTAPLPTLFSISLLGGRRRGRPARTRRASTPVIVVPVVTALTARIDAAAIVGTAGRCGAIGIKTFGRLESRTDLRFLLGGLRKFDA